MAAAALQPQPQEASQRCRRLFAGGPDGPSPRFIRNVVVKVRMQGACQPSMHAWGLPCQVLRRLALWSGPGQRAVRLSFPHLPACTAVGMLSRLHARLALPTHGVQLAALRRGAWHRRMLGRIFRRYLMAWDQHCAAYFFK